jgi:thiamine biosynthesis lipoprotein
MIIANRRWTVAVILFYSAVVALLAVACESRRRVTITGKTMGTVYHIAVMAPVMTRTNQLHREVDVRLAEINSSMSTYIPSSEISRFNALNRAEQPFPASSDFLSVLRVGQRIFSLTGGAWDGTVWPLVRLWGFHLPVEKRNRIPTREEVGAALACVGYDNIWLREDAVVKKVDCVSLDLASIAKGFGVDQIAALLKKKGLNDFLVEIGGEIIVSGTKEKGAPWNVGINMPEAYAPVDQVRRALTLTNQAIATSGDYRNFFVREGREYCHIIDPRTGYPVTTGIVSASVIADTCTLADGLATALMVMPPDQGLALVNSLEGVECLLTVREPDGQLKDYYSDHFNKY